MNWTVWYFPLKQFWFWGKKSYEHLQLSDKRWKDEHLHHFTGEKPYSDVPWYPEYIDMDSFEFKEGKDKVVIRFCVDSLNSRVLQAFEMPAGDIWVCLEKAL